MLSRRAVSLTELLVVMSAASAILTTGTALIHRAMHNHSGAQKFFADERNSSRLANQFRQDVHQAQQAVLDKSALPADVFVQLQLSDTKRIEYRRQQETLYRTLFEQDRPVWREEYHLPGAVLSIAADEPNQLVLTAVPSADPSSRGSIAGCVSRPPPPALRVVAYLGRQASGEPSENGN